MNVLFFIRVKKFTRTHRFFIGKVICSVEKELVSKETVVLRRWKSRDESVLGSINRVDK